MKKNTFTKGLVSMCLIAMVMAFTSCSSDDSNMEYVQKETATANTGSSASVSPYTLKLQALANGKDVTTKGDVENVTLFVFDEKYNYIETKTIDKSTVLNCRTISIAANATDKITVVAYAGLLNNKEEVSSLNQNSILTDLRVQLKQNNGQVTNSPSDLFHGQLSIDRASVTRSEETPVLAIERKVAELSLSTTGIAKRFGDTNGEFYYKIKTSTSMINYNGEVTGEDSEYILPATVNAAGNVTADNIAILPSDDVVIELYRDDILVLSSSNLRNTQDLSVNASEQLNIVFDAYKSNLSLVVAAWGQVVIRQNVA